MPYSPGFSVGQIVSNSEIISEFHCGNMGGMRKSNLTNSLVLITDHTKGLYEDTWYGDILHYTGMGKSGDQRLDFMQNKTLTESNNTDVSVFLFEVFEEKRYIFHGRVKLIDAPYQADQVGEDGLYRRVWIFPIKTIDGIVSVSNAVLDEFYMKESNKAKKLQDNELFARAKNRQKTRPSCRTVEKVNTFVRDPYVSEYSKRRANGICQLCDSAAPFKTHGGEWYLESHHIEWLSRGGSDTIENTCALCPNCHRRMHILDERRDIVFLKNRVRTL